MNITVGLGKERKLLMDIDNTKPLKSTGIRDQEPSKPLITRDGFMSATQDGKKLDV